MTALATVADAATFGYVLDPTDGPKFLNRASARIRGYSGQQISRVTNDVVKLPVIRNTVYLPERPADKPTEVKFGTVVFLEDTAWHWNPIRYSIEAIDPWINTGNFTGWWKDCEQILTVTYSHGFTTLPEDLLEVVCAVAYRMASGTNGRERGVSSEGVLGVNISYAPESLESAATLLPSEKAIIDKILGKRQTASLPLGVRKWG